MQISFITMNRLVEDKAATDEQCRRQLQKNGKVVLSDGRALSDEALLARLGSFNLVLDRNQFLTLAQRYFSAEAMARAVYQAPGQEIEYKDQDWVWIAFTCFWERWLPERPSLEMIDDWMQDGYKALARGDLPGTCRLWLAAWKGIWNILEAVPLRTVEEFDAHFPTTSSLFNWVQDLVRELHHAGLEDRSFLEQRLTLLETLLGRLQLDGLLLVNLKNDLAETYFALGMPEKGEQLYRQWLHDEPHRGWGWIGWSDCYVRFVRDEQKDPARGEQILKQGLAIPGVEDRKYLLDRLAWLYAETGRAAEAQVVRAEIRKLDQPPVPVTAEAQGTHVRITETFSFGANGLPVEDLGRFAAALRGRNPRPGGGKAGTGRNDRCPCGSGKKFKRCCGRNVG